MLDWMKHKLESRLPGEISLFNDINLRYADDTTLMAESTELKSLLMKVKEESEKVGLKLNKILAIKTQECLKRILYYNQVGLKLGKNQPKTS